MDRDMPLTYYLDGSRNLPIKRLFDSIISFRGNFVSYYINLKDKFLLQFVNNDSEWLYHINILQHLDYSSICNIIRLNRSYYCTPCRYVTEAHYANLKSFSKCTWILAGTLRRPMLVGKQRFPIIQPDAIMNVELMKHDRKSDILPIAVQDSSYLIHKDLKLIGGTYLKFRVFPFTYKPSNILQLLYDRSCSSLYNQHMKIRVTKGAVRLKYHFWFATDTIEVYLDKFDTGIRIINSGNGIYITHEAQIPLMFRYKCNSWDTLRKLSDDKILKHLDAAYAPFLIADKKEYPNVAYYKDMIKDVAIILGLYDLKSDSANDHFKIPRVKIQTLDPPDWSYINELIMFNSMSNFSDQGTINRSYTKLNKIIYRDPNFIKIFKDNELTSSSIAVAFYQYFGVNLMGNGLDMFLLKNTDVTAKTMLVLKNHTNYHIYHKGIPADKKEKLHDPYPNKAFAPNLPHSVFGMNLTYAIHESTYQHDSDDEFELLDDLDEDDYDDDFTIYDD